MSVPTVRDVVAHLLTLDQDLPVYVPDHDGTSELTAFHPKRHARVGGVRSLTAGCQRADEDLDRPIRPDSAQALLLGDHVEGEEE